VPHAGSPFVFFSERHLPFITNAPNYHVLGVKNGYKKAGGWAGFMVMVIIRLLMAGRRLSIVDVRMPQKV
jgi:hypothetical protein